MTHWRARGRLWCGASVAADSYLGFNPGAGCSHGDRCEVVQGILHFKANIVPNDDTFVIIQSGILTPCSHNARTGRITADVASIRRALISRL